MSRERGAPVGTGLQSLDVGLGNKENWWAEMPVRPPGPHRRLRGWLIISTGFLLPLLIPAFGHVLSVDASGWWKVLTLTALVGYGLCYVFFPLVAPTAARWVTFTFSVGMVLLGLALVGLHGVNSYAIIYAVAVVVFLLPAGWALIIVGSALLLILVALLVSGQLSAGISHLISVSSIAMTMFVVSRLVFAVRALQRANEEIATLAVTNERERMARDLHDILGHSLTTIAVKAGLARRVLESSNDTDRAIIEIHEVEGLARRALSDVRATVSEYREVSLSAELVGARAALRAAEIDAEFPSAVDNVHPDLQPAFGYVLREAVTNVLRHSGAHRVKVRLGRTWMEIEDDGVGVVTASPGNGLRGLQERLAEVGGRLNAAARPEGGFLVRADAQAGDPA